MLDPQAAHWWIHLVAQCKENEQGFRLCGGCLITGVPSVSLEKHLGQQRRTALMANTDVICLHLRIKSG